MSKAALLEAGWPGTVVEEGNLTVQIAALRKALGTRGDGQEWIVTVPRVGYRLLRAAPTQEAAGLAHIALLRGEDEKAADHANRALTSRPDFNPAHWMLIAAYAHRGRLDAAKKQLAALEKLTPGMTISRTLSRDNPLHLVRMMRIMEGLRLAGMPE